MREIRAGIPLSDFDAKLFDYVKANPGIGTAELGARFGRKPSLIAAHIYYINERMLSTEVRIKGVKTFGYRVHGLKKGE